MEPMENIRRAMERANAEAAVVKQAPPQSRATRSGISPRNDNDFILNGAHLESNRIISHDVKDRRAKSFDMLRTQILQTMGLNSWQLLAVTSPTPRCGKSVVAANLALSIARHPEKSVLLVDMDLRRPQVARHLGLRRDQGLLSVLEGKSTLARAIVPAGIGNSRFLVLPCERSVINSSEWMASRAMTALMSDIRRQYEGWTIILDLPPILATDDVISILPQIDCVLFVAAAGFSTAPEIKECNKHLEAIPVVRVVLNKAVDADARYYYYSRYSYAPAAKAKSKPAGNFGRSPPSSFKRFIDRIARF
jgi:protein-tyrosine kinase